jgi:hypothetical protein
VRTDLTGADLTGCRVYGVSAWDLKLDGAKQQNLVMAEKQNLPWEELKQLARGETGPAPRLAAPGEFLSFLGVKEPDMPAITVDNIEVAQFIYLMLNNQKVREVIDTITSKAVLILGRFTEERKPVLEALRQELRQRKYLPILFDFAVPATRDITETVSLLARMARFIIADLTDPSSIAKELEAIVPHLAVPVQPVLQVGHRPMRCSRTIGSTSGCFRSTDTRGLSRWSQLSRRRSSPLRKGR